MKLPGGPQRSSGLWLLVLAYAGVGFSIYFSLGVVAKRGLAYTPLIFLAAGVLFVLTVASYLEGSAMLRERGGSSSYARHAFNELVAFVAGWVILLDYLIVIALAALSVPHYLTPIFGDLGDRVWAAVVIAAVILYATALNWLDITARRRPRFIMVLAGADLLVQLLILLVGVAVVMNPDALTGSLGLAGGPGVEDLIYSVVLATLAYAGIEAMANLVPDLDLNAKRFTRVVTRAIWLVPVLYALIAAVALMAVPVAAGPSGPETALGSTYIEAPILGVVEAFRPEWIADTLQILVAVIASGTLIWAANTAMFGVSRHVYALAVNRQIPSWLAKLDTRYETPYRAIVICALIALGLAVTGDIEMLAGIYAFGATLAITIGHLSIIRLRRKMPDAARPFRAPLNLNRGPGGFPVSAALGALLSGLALLSVILLHDTARWVGLAWLTVGLVGYVVYRRAVEGISLTERFTVEAKDLVRRRPAVAFRRILVPIFGTPLDDDIVSTAGRMAAETDDRPGGTSAELVIVQLSEVPLKRAIEDPLPAAEERAAATAAERAFEVASEYGGVKVTVERRRVRRQGTGIVATARLLEADAIVMGAEPPSPVKGGAQLGGKGDYRPPEIGPVTAYVLKRAPCRVILTAPPA
ncbi:MAG: amino acid permease [Solirubrobacterales bacterium]|nr:amino acid permease [Solirubrobacterales bacterium]